MQRRWQYRLCEKSLFQVSTAFKDRQMHIFFKNSDFSHSLGRPRFLPDYYRCRGQASLFPACHPEFISGSLLPYEIPKRVRNDNTLLRLSHWLHICHPESCHPEQCHPKLVSGLFQDHFRVSRNALPKSLHSGLL